MRSLGVRAGAAEARQTLTEAWRLIRSHLPATLELGLVLALGPGVVNGLFFCASRSALLSVLEGWARTVLSGGKPAEGLLTLVYAAVRTSGDTGLAATLAHLLLALLITPLLLSSLALLYNGHVSQAVERQSLDAARRAAGNARGLVLVAVCCMAAQWLVGILPSIASGLLSAVARLLAFIPFIGTAVTVLTVALTALLSVLAAFAADVLFCYVWICAACEGVTGLGALARSWQLTRGAARQTVAALLTLTALRWGLYGLLVALWLLLNLAFPLPLRWLVMGLYGAGACGAVFLGAITSALYLRRPASQGPWPGGPDLSRMKRANLDG